jgi:hypothetical protein
MGIDRCGAAGFGTLPFFLGLAVVIRVLGHATWHLYRRLVAPDPNPRPVVHHPRREPRVRGGTISSRRAMF